MCANCRAQMELFFFRPEVIIILVCIANLQCLISSSFLCEIPSAAIIILYTSQCCHANEELIPV